MKSDFDKLCRICGNFDSQLMPIFSGDGLEHNLPGKIEKHLFSITIKENDSLPQKVCYQCVSSLVIWSDLFDLSIEISRNFNNELKQSKQKKTITPEISFVEVMKDNDFIDTLKIEDAEMVTNTKLTVDNLLEETVTAKIFNDINDFDAFLNNSPASSVSLESDIEPSEDEESELLTEKVEITEQIDTIEVDSESSDIPDNVELPSTELTSQIQDHFLTAPVPTEDLESNEDVQNEESTLQTEDAQNPNPTDSTEAQPVKKKRRYRPKDPERGKFCGCMCDVCGKVFKVPETLKVHVKTVHTADRPHICPLCGTRFKRKDHLDCHIKYTHGDEKYPRRPCLKKGTTYKAAKRERLCIHCGKILSSTHLLKEHINSFHSDQRPYKCEKCNLSFNRYSNLYHHSVIRNHQVCSTFFKSCEICGLDFRYETFYLRHKWKHPETVYCDKCQIKFDNNELFRQHIETMHEEKKLLQCDTCGKKFRTKASLKIHVRVHTGERPYQCQYCSWRFHKKGQLVVHIYRHTGEKPYTCSICGRGFKQRGDMRKHKVGHIKQIKKNSTPA